MAPSHSFTIAGLGEILWDIYGTQRHLGGAPANFALHVNRLGHEGVIMSKIGDDEDGRKILQTLNERKVAIDRIQIDPVKPTGTVTVSLNAKGKPNFLCSREVAFDYFDDFSVANHTPEKFDALLFGTLAQRNRVSRRSIRNFISAGPAQKVIFDANLREINATTQNIVQFSLQHADILKLNDDEAKLLPRLLNKQGENEKGFFRDLMDTYGLELVLVTLGEKGVWAMGRNGDVFAPGYRIPVVDTTGAGDGFIAAFITTYLQNKRLAYCLDFANALGALIATRQGAVPEYDQDEIFRLMESSPKVRGELAQINLWNR